MTHLEQALVAIKSDEEAVAFLKLLFAPQEIPRLRHRWQIFQLGIEGSSNREISKRLGVAVMTAGRGCRAAKNNPELIRKLMKRIK
jgi:uncharacterized protein YerC